MPDHPNRPPTTPIKEAAVMQEYTTTKGTLIRTGQRWHDARPTNRRTLRVDSIGEPYDPNKPDWRTINLTVTAVDGEPITERSTTMTARRLGGRDFVLVTETDRA